LFEEINWTFIFSLGSFFALSLGAFFTFHRYYWLLHKERVEKNKRELYQPLRWTIERLLEWIKDVKIDAIRDTSIPYEENRYSLPVRLYELLKDFSSRKNRFADLATACKESFDLIIFQKCEQDSYYQLTQAYRGKYGKSLADDLSKEITPAIMQGTTITKSWVLDNTRFLDRMKEINEESRFSNLIEAIFQEAKGYHKKRLLNHIVAERNAVMKFGNRVRSIVEKHARPPRYWLGKLHYFLGKQIKVRLED